VLAHWRAAKTQYEPEAPSRHLALPIAASAAQMAPAIHTAASDAH